MNGRTYLQLPDGERTRIAVETFRQVAPLAVSLLSRSDAFLEALRVTLDDAARDDPSQRVTVLIETATSQMTAPTPKRPRPAFAELCELIETAEDGGAVDTGPLRARMQAVLDRVRAAMGEAEALGVGDEVDRELRDEVDQSIVLMGLYFAACDQLDAGDVAAARATLTEVGHRIDEG